ncbi:hypothetical protein I546_2255, partial [Mycobacterium kansasii 732]
MGLWPIAEEDSGGGEVDVVDVKRPQLGGGGAVQQPEQADQRLVRVQ